MSTSQVLKTINGYNHIADEYYDEVHKATRNFDVATLDYFEKNGQNLDINTQGLVLELGAGKGRTTKYCKISSSRIVQTDISKSMLMLPGREPCLQRIRCDSLNLPFSKEIFSIVTAFLYDPYNIHNSNSLSIYKNISELLQEGGLFIGTLPHEDWGNEFRKIRKQSRNEASFLTRNKELISVNSFLMNDESINEALDHVGLTLVGLHNLKLPKEICPDDVSKGLKDAAYALGMDVYSLPIVKLILARKPR